MSSRLVVLGSCGAWPEAGRACSGFVLEYDGFRVVLDLGYATLPRLLAVLGSSVADGIDAVVVTHRHADHAIDLHGLFRARWFGRRSAAPLPAPTYQLGPFRLGSWDLPHYVPNAGVRLSTPGLVVAYTGDTGPDAALSDLGRDADLYIMEASDRDQQDSTPPAPTGPRMHLSAREAGQAAAAAGARRLLLSHFWPGNDRQASHAAAAVVFPGEILLAEEDLKIRLP